MKNWQYYALQSNIMIACSLASTHAVSKGVFLFLAILNLVAVWFSRND